MGSFGGRRWRQAALLCACAAALQCGPARPAGRKRAAQSDDGGDIDTADAGGDGMDLVPPALARALVARGFKSLLPVQRRSYAAVRDGLDLVVQSPTATGKTLAYALPMLARFSATPRLPSAAAAAATKAGRDAAAAGVAPADKVKRVRPVPAPRCIVLAPSRELCRQIGEEFAYFANNLRENSDEAPVNVATCYGGAPMERSIASLRSKGGADIVVATPGRLAELLRRGTRGVKGETVELTLSALETFVFDEADALLDEQDTPEVRRFMDSMDHDYQLVLLSATITAKVRKFARGAMQVEADDSFVDAEDIARTERIEHLSLAAVNAEWAGVTADVLATRDAPLALVFARSISEVRDLAESLRVALGTRYFDVQMLHGDLDPQARRRAIKAVASSEARRSVLVATDVASRGLDLPNVGLVVQLGVPRRAGVEGTFDHELYAHRSGRAGREQTATRDSCTSILVFDPEAGERMLLKKLADTTKTPSLLKPIAPPSANDVVDAAVKRALNEQETIPDALVDAIMERMTVPRSEARALAALSGLTTLPVARSLLTARAAERTLRVDVDETANELSPTDVVKTLKALGSGKLDRINLSASKRSALVDVPTAKLDAVLEEAKSGLPPGWRISLPVE